MLKCIVKNFVRANNSIRTYKLFNEHKKLLETNTTVLKLCRCMHNTQNCYQKLFTDKENTHAYSVVSDLVVKIEPSSLTEKTIATRNEFENYMLQNWRSASTTEIVNAFKNVLNYCINNNINVSDPIFNNLTDGLMDNVEHLTDEQLSQLLICLKKFPYCDSYQSHNYHDIWSALDDVCFSKITSWDMKTMFYFASLWFQLHLGRLSDTVFEVVDRCNRRAKFLTKDELVQSFFFINICRRLPIQFNTEGALASHVRNMTVDELGVVAMGYFKTQSKIKLKSIIDAMVDSLIENSATVNEITASAILKILRYSSPVKQSDKIVSLLDALYPQIDRLSNLCCLHIALLGTTMQILHEDTLIKISQKLADKIDDVHEVRMKEIERILMCLTMFNVDPRTEPDIFQACLEQLKGEKRINEFERYERCLPCTMHYLSMRTIYSDKLLNKVMDKGYMEKVYGKRYIPKEILSLDCCVEIEYPTYKGKRLDIMSRRRAAKYHTEHIPNFDHYKKNNATDQLLLDVINKAKIITGDSNYVHVSHVLPHFSRADVILCRDKETGVYVKPSILDSYWLGDIKRPSNLDKYKWLAIVIAGWNNTVRDTSSLLGPMIMKERQLKRIGYETIFVIWCEFMLLSEEEKLNYIINKINEV